MVSLAATVGLSSIAFVLSFGFLPRKSKIENQTKVVTLLSLSSCFVPAHCKIASCFYRPRNRTTTTISNWVNMVVTVGVLALQGGFSEHLHSLRKASARRAQASSSQSQTGSDFRFVEVRTPEQLATCHALVIPGGESTTLSLVAAQSGLLQPLRDFVKYVTSLPICICLGPAPVADCCELSGSARSRPGERVPASSSCLRLPARRRGAVRNLSGASTSGYIATISGAN